MAKFSTVDKDECIACGSCGELAPEIFDYDDDGYAMNIYEDDGNTGTVEVDKSLQRELIDAEESCPTGAIKVAATPFF